MASQEKREFDKYLKFLTFKTVQVIVQSRQGVKISTKSNSTGNDWFNLSILDDRQVSSELKRSLDGKLPEHGQPVCIEILMDTPEGDSIVLEVWSIELDNSQRDVSVSVAHLLYPRLSLMLRSLVVLSRTTPTYRLSRCHEDTLKFTFRLYASSPDLNTEGFRSVVCAKTLCPFGTISLSLLYRESITLPDRPVLDPCSIDELIHPPAANTSSDDYRESSLPPSLPHLPFSSHSSHSAGGCGLHLSDHTPFSTILSPHAAEDYQREESHDTLTSSDGGGGGGNEGDVDSLSLPTADHEQDGYVMVDLTNIRPTFATDAAVDELGQFLQNCREVPTLDLLTGEDTMDIDAAMKLVDEKTMQLDSQRTSVDLS